MKKPLVVYWNNMPSPYMVERFNAVAHRDMLDLRVWFSTRIATDRSWSVDETHWEFPYRYLPSLGGGEHPLALPTPLFRESMPDLLVSLYASPSFLLGWSWARIRGARTAFWAEVTFDSWVSRRAWKERLKSFVLARADAIFTAGQDGGNYVRRYGVEEHRTFVIPHVIDFQYYHSRESTLAEREALRDTLGLRGVTFVYAGRFWWGKGLKYLVDAYAELQRVMESEISLLLVGDGPDEGSLRQRCREEKLRNVVFAGFHQANTLPQLYGAGDVFVFPTLGDPFGMVVPEAMACGLPVVSTSAAGELRDRLRDGINGFVVPPADSDALFARMEQLARDPELRKGMARAATQTVASQTPVLWAEAFEHAVSRVLSMPKNRRN